MKLIGMSRYFIRSLTEFYFIVPTEAKQHTEHVIVSNATTIESTIAKAVNTLKNLTS